MSSSGVDVVHNGKGSEVMWEARAARGRGGVETSESAEGTGRVRVVVGWAVTVVVRGNDPCGAR